MISRFTQTDNNAQNFPIMLRYDLKTGKQLRLLSFLRLTWWFFVWWFFVLITTASSFLFASLSCVWIALNSDIPEIAEILTGLILRACTGVEVISIPPLSWPLRVVVTCWRFGFDFNTCRAAPSKARCKLRGLLSCLGFVAESSLGITKLLLHSAYESKCCLFCLIEFRGYGDMLRPELFSSMEFCLKCFVMRLDAVSSTRQWICMLPFLFYLNVVK